MQVDFGTILKRAWDITWRNKTLWWLGLFAGGATSANVNWNSNYNSLQRGTSTWGSERVWLDSVAPRLSSTLADWLPFLLVIGGFLLVLGLVMMVLSVAAGGGLVTEVNEAAEGRQVSATRGWGAGFAKWWRLAAIYAVLALPFLVLGLILFAGALFVIIVPFAAGTTPEAGGLAAFVGVAALLALILVPVGIVVGVLQLLATRYAMLEDVVWSEAIVRGWGAIRTRFKDVALMWLVMLAVSIGLGIAMVLPLLLFVLPVVALVIARLWFGLVFVGLAAVLVLWAVAAAVNTFVSAAWTIFWRQMTGREPGKLPVAWPTPTAGWPQQAPPAYQPGYPTSPSYPPPPAYPPAPAPAPQPPAPQPPAPQPPAPEPPATPPSSEGGA